MPTKVSHPCRNGLNASIYKDKPSDISIADVLHYLKVNNNGQYPKRIVIIAGGLAARGISFVSAYYDWHLRAMCYVEPKSASMPQMVQKVGRVCGTNKGGAPTITLYCPPGTALKLKEGRAVMKHMMEKVDEQFAATGESSGYANDIAKTAMNIKFKTSVKLTKKAALLKPSAWVEVEVEVEVESESEAEAKARAEVESEFARLIIKMFPKWSTELDGSSKIATFVDSLDPTKTGEKAYSDADMREQATQHGIKNFGQLSTIHVGKGHGFGTIIQKNESDDKKTITWQLCPELVVAHKKYFS